MSTKDLEASYSLTARRKIFYRFPEGKFTLQGLLSLMDTEATDKPKFGWFEQREAQHYTTTAQSPVGAGNIGPFTNAANDTLQTQAGFTIAANAQFCITVASTEPIHVRDVLWLKSVPNGAASALLNPRVLVDEIVSSTVLKVRATTGAITSMSNDTDANGLHVLVVGSAASEGARSRSGSYQAPIEVENYTQIHRNGFKLTGNALKAGLVYDKSGAYKGKSTQAMQRHMELLEKAAMFGRRGVNNVIGDDGDLVPERLSGGILWYLEQWELGNTGNGGLFDYRPGGSDVSNTAWTSADEKLIIPVNGTMTKANFETLNERLFRYNGNSGEKLVLCGNGFIKAFQDYVKLGATIQMSLHEKEEVYGMKIFRWTTPWGDLIFKSHPLFNQNAGLRNSAFVLDVGSIHYININDRDSQLLKNRQPNDADYRKDEWFTECGIELHYPERHHFIDNLTGVVA
jgi:hypothetical protein